MRRKRRAFLPKALIAQMLTREDDRAFGPEELGILRAARAGRARAAGVEVLKDVGPGPYGLTVYLADPDGNRIELFAEDET